MDDDATLKSETYVRACIRACAARGVPAFVTRRGFAEAGAVLIKLNLLGEGAFVLVQSRDAAGQPVWRRGTGPDAVPDDKAEDYIQRQIRYDPDLWVIEIEDRAGAHPLGEAISD